MTAVKTKNRHDPARVSHKRVSRGGLAIVLGLVLAGSLLVAGPASAASRGFKLSNNSSFDLELVDAKRVPTVKCVDFSLCVETFYDMDFEGRPGDGSALNAGGKDTWELKYAFSILGGIQYAADLWYKIVGTDDLAHYRIETYPTSNESKCDIVGTKKYGCEASGLRLEFKNQGAG